MNDEVIKRYWNENALAWTELTRAGHDVYRDHLNTPAFFEILPNVNGLRGLDIGCGEGHNTRLLAKQGAIMHGLDISDVFIEKARETDQNVSFDIVYKVGNAAALPYPTGEFEFGTSFMCLMDVPDFNKAFQEAYRILKPGGFFQFSISHPCFSTPHRRNLRNENGETYAIEVGNYFEKISETVAEWTFSNAPKDLRQKFAKFKVPVFHRTLTEWFSAIKQSGFAIEQISEPAPSASLAKDVPAIQDARVVSYFLHIRCRK